MKIMDKRAIKSKNAIIATFLALIKTKPVERLTVKELCEKARINKSTFYAHYHDLQDLSAQLEAELVYEILHSLPRNDLYSLKTSELFAVDLYQALIRYEPQIELLFPNQKRSCWPAGWTGRSRRMSGTSIRICATVSKRKSC